MAADADSVQSGEGCRKPAQARRIARTRSAGVLDGATTTVIDDRFPYGEERLVTFGYVGQRLYVAVYTVRDESLRMISVRKANAREQARYG